MRRTALLALLAVVPLALWVAGCASPITEFTDDTGYSDSALEATGTDNPYVVVWQAMQAVLTDEYGRVISSSFPGQQQRRLLVYSRINGDMLTKTRLKIEAFIRRDSSNDIYPMIYVWEQIENDAASLRPARNAESAWLFGSYSPSRIWTNIGRNERMEARLTNMVFERLEGRTNPLGGRFMMDNKPWVDFKAVPRDYTGKELPSDAAPSDREAPQETTPPAASDSTPPAGSQ